MIGITFSTITDDVQRNELQVFYAENYKRFMYIAMQKVNDKESAADVIQEVFSDIADKPEIFFNVPKGERVTFVDILVRNTAICTFKKELNRTNKLQELHEDIIDESVRIEDDAITKDTREELVKYILTLPEQQRTVYGLRVITGLPISDIAEQLGIARETVNWHLKMARRTSEILLMKGTSAMSEDVLKEIMLEVHRIECGVPDNLPDFKPSLRHRLAMKRIFARFERNTWKMKNEETTQELPASEHRTMRYSIKQRIIIATLIIVLMTLLAGCVSTIAKFISEYFNGTVYEDNTQLFGADLENCPQTIEYQYVLTNVPEGFELIKTIPSSTNVCSIYLNGSTGQTITLEQWVKSHFSSHYNTEKSTFEENEINGTTILFIDLSSDKRNNSVFIWDNDDYIIEISADLDKNSALDLLDITKL